jgi:pyruvate,water dikinase
MSHDYVLRFTAPEATTHDLVGGKGANLGRLTSAGFPVPPGFTVTTRAYADALQTDGLGTRVAELAAVLAHDDADAVERATAEIRELVSNCALPSAVAAAIVEAYAELGDDVYVAVRSSGTAEDLEGSSFAGLHDTYLDITSADGVLDAVRRCWASLWTARAASYRNTKGFGQDVGIGVVVQRMVPSTVAGVMFTANPLTAATDEIIVNASWGLGEAVVAGITTPDSFVLDHETMGVLEQTLGTKEKQVVRDPESGRGTVVQDVPDEQRERFCLEPDALAQLGVLGRRVQSYYGGFPQDTEWGYADGEFFLLQSRPVTGVSFSWDDQVDAWQWLLRAAHDTVWTRNWSDEVWTGGVTPLMYSYRARCYTMTNENAQQIWGQPKLSQTRMFRYYKGGAYYNCNLDAAFIAGTAWPSTRPMMLANIPAAWHEDVLGAPFSVAEYVRLQARCRFLDRAHGVDTWWEKLEYYLYETFEEAGGLPDAALRELSDADLEAYIRKQIAFEAQYIIDVWSGFFMHFRDGMAALATMVGRWYTGDNATAFTDLITGAPEPSAAMVETYELWKLSQEIRESPVLSSAFAGNEGHAFFDACATSDEGRGWLEHYAAFVADHGHRGHADRDIYFTRRAEDPAVDYRALVAFLGATGDDDPRDREHLVEARRQLVIAEVTANIAAKPLGKLRVALFTKALSYITRLLKARDDQRHWVDRATFTIKRGFLEVSRRLHERGVLDGERDVYFLTVEEVFDVLDGVADLPLTRAKIAGRMANFDRIDQKVGANPMYVSRNQDADFEYDRIPGEELPDGMLRGVGTSSGTVEGTARVIKELKDIGRVRSGEILVVNATDPGWTPVFLLINGIVLETGGMLAHGSCLAREYGMPAVHLPRAMQHIPDGARVRVNGDVGLVEVLDEASVLENTESEVAA